MNKTIKQISFTFILVGFLQIFLSAQEDLNQALLYKGHRTKADINELFPGKDLVSIPYSTSIVRYRDEDWALGFVLDSGWNRILYGKVYLGGFYPIKWTKATGPTGSGWNDVLLDNPEGIATDIPDVDDTPHERDVYVADTGNRRVVKLHYDPSPSIEDFVSVDYFTGFNRPSDVDVDNRGTVLDPSDDIIWVADRSDNAVVAISPQGSQLAILTSYLQLDGTERLFYRPDRLTIGQHPSIWGGDENRLYIIETSVTNKLIGLEIQTDLTLEEVFTYQFPDGVFPTDMDTDDRGDLWISAGNEGKLYRILRSGEMLGTFGNPGTGENQFNYPKSVSNFIGKDHMIITEHYTSSSGGKVFQAGGDVVNFNHNQISNVNTYLNYTFTNWCNASAWLEKGTNSIEPYSEQTVPSGIHTDNVSVDEVGAWTLYVDTDPLHASDAIEAHTYQFVMEILEAPASVVAEGGVMHIDLSWDPLPGVNQYKIYRATSPDGSFQYLETVSSTQYNDFVTDYSTTYYYKVRGLEPEIPEGPASAVVSAQALHLASRSTDATSPSVNRHIVYSTSNSQYHCVYEDNGDIYYSTSWDGVTWSNENLLSSSANCSNPSIGINYRSYNSSYYVQVAWEIPFNVQLNDRVGCKIRELGSQSWNYSFASNDFFLYSQPVVPEYWAEKPLLVVKKIDLINPEDPLYSNYILMEKDTYSSEIFLEKAVVPGTTPNSQGLSASWAPNNDLHMCWEESGQIKYISATYIGGTWSFGPVEDLSSAYPTISGHKDPTIITDESYDGNVYIAWKARVTEYPKERGGRVPPGPKKYNRIIYRKNTGSGWSSPAIISYQGQHAYTPSIALNHWDNPSSVALTWRSHNNIVYMPFQNPSTPFFTTNLGQGRYPSLEPLNISARSVVWSGYSGPPYDIHAETIHSRNRDITESERYRGLTSLVAPQGDPAAAVLYLHTEVSEYSWFHHADTTETDFAESDSSQNLLQWLDSAPVEVSGYEDSLFFSLYVTGFVDLGYDLGEDVFCRVLLHSGSELRSVETIDEISYSDLVPDSTGGIHLLREYAVDLTDWTGQSVWVSYEFPDWSDQAHEATTTLYYWPTSGEEDRIHGTLSVGLSVMPSDFTLHPNHPNPFNPTTDIRYDLPEASYVSLVIYDILGREVRRLLDSRVDAGFKSVVWDGRDDTGNSVSTGIYIYMLRVWSLESEQTYQKTTKMILLR